MSTKNKQKGFTLIELAIVTPMMILIALSIVAILIMLVTATVGPNARSILMQQEEKSLDIMESDINNSTTFLSSLPANFSDSNSNNYSSPPSGTEVLRIQGFDQITNPNDNSGTKVIPAFMDTAVCSNTTNLGSSNIVPVVFIYYVNNNTLYRRTLVDNTSPQTCGTKLAKQTCQSGCTSTDLELLKADTINNFNIVYYTSITGNITTSNPTLAKSALITIVSSLEAGGETHKYTATFRAARLN